MNYIENTENDNAVWIEVVKMYLKDKRAMKNVLNAINQSSAKIIKINKPYIIGNDRVGVMLRCKYCNAYPLNLLQNTVTQNLLRNPRCHTPPNQ